MPKHRLEQTAAMLKREVLRFDARSFRARPGRHRADGFVLELMAALDEPTPEPRPASSHVARQQYGAHDAFGCCERGEHG